MGAGGTAEAMKFSDVLILSGIAILCAGFIIHGWVESTELDSAENSMMVKSFDTLKGDEIIIVIKATSDLTGSLKITDGSTEVFMQNIVLTEGDSYEHNYKSKSLGSHDAEIILESGEASAEIDISRVFLLDFIVYPLGAALLLFGLQKRRENMKSEAVDAELDSN